MYNVRSVHGSYISKPISVMCDRFNHEREDITGGQRIGTKKNENT